MTNEQLDALVERTARAWASIYGQAEAFDACKADPAREETEGHYGGYLTEAKELLRRSGVADAITTLLARAEAAEADAERLAEDVSFHRSQAASAMLCRYMNAPEDPHVEALCDRYGYGAVMDAASRLWARKDSVGAFYVGGCIGMKSDDEAHAALVDQVEKGA